MTRQLANNEQLPFQSVFVKPFGTAYEQHFHVRSAVARRIADVCRIVVNRQWTPAEQRLPLLSDEFLNGLLAGGSLLFVLRQKDNTRTVTTGGRQIDLDVFLWRHAQETYVATRSAFRHRHRYSIRIHTLLDDPYAAECDPHRRRSGDFERP